MLDNELENELQNDDSEIYDDNEIDDSYDEADEDSNCSLSGNINSNISQKNRAINGKSIEWEQSLSVDIPEIDELQKKIFAMLNGLINNHDQDDEIVKDGAAMVAELTEYSRYYFSKEEEYLRRCGYPDIDCHSKEHRQFIKNTINLRRQVSEDKKNLCYDSVSNLRDWLVNHISGTDHIYVPFVRINNYVEECRIKRLI
ncbi:MAG: hemerythrin family protein [Desulfamplus sp.]|nr:hemerythrin family protein [Desulfamplus sp.]